MIVLAPAKYVKAIGRKKTERKMRNRLLAYSSMILMSVAHKKVIIAIARILLTVLYNMLKNKEPYNAKLYRRSDKLLIEREIASE